MTRFVDKNREWVAGLLAQAPRGTKTRLAKALGVRPDAISRLTGNGKEMRDLKADELIKIAQFFNVPPPGLPSASWGHNDAKPQSEESSYKHEVDYLTERKESPRQVEPSQNAHIAGTATVFARIPVRGRAMGGESGAIAISDGDFGGTLAPPQLADVPGAYAVYVVGNSMLERYREGELVYAHPYKPAIPGDDVVVQVTDDDGATIRGYIKRFVSKDDKFLKVAQLNPPQSMKFPISKVVAVHLIVMGGRGF